MATITKQDICEELSRVGDEFLSQIRKESGLEMDSSWLFRFVIGSFIKNFPKDGVVPPLEDILNRFRKALPQYTTQVCVFVEQVKATSECVWETKS